MKPLETIRYRRGRLSLLDQTRLPDAVVYLDCVTVDDVHAAIQRLSVRGAPAIGIAAAYGVCLAGSDTTDDGPDAVPLSLTAVENAVRRLRTSRPTAVNLFWALDRMRGLAEAADCEGGTDLRDVLETEAAAIAAEDARSCRAIGRHGAERLGGYRRFLTHCNAGSLAASPGGTALSPLYELHRRGRPVEVLADETRPLCQGSRLTAWELHHAGIPVRVQCDAAAASAMRRGEIEAVIVGADRIAANGDVANKVGTDMLAVLAAHHGIPFFVAAPLSTFDPTVGRGGDIPIEQRSSEELTWGRSGRWVPEGVDTRNPAFDVTPAELITAIITDAGIVEPVDEPRIGHLLSQNG